MRRDGRGNQNNAASNGKCYVGLDDESIQLPLKVNPSIDAATHIKPPTF